MKKTKGGIPIPFMLVRTKADELRHEQILYLRFAPDHHMFALFDSDLGDNGQALDKSALLADSVGQRAKEGPRSSAGALLEV